MKTKIITAIISLSSIGISFNSCTNLDEKIYSEIISDELKPTEDDVISVVAPAYTAMRDVLFGWTGFFDVQEESSDEIVTPGRPGGWIDGGIYKTMHCHTWTSLQSHLRGVWTNIYSGVNYCNRYIYQIESGALNVNEDLKDDLIAELRAMRCLYYYLLLDNFRDVAFIDKYDVPDDYLPEQISSDKLFQWIESELKDVVPLLTEEVDMSTYGRMTKWSASFLLARLYLNAEVYVNQARYADCEELCTAIMNSGKFQLTENYKDNFITENQNSTELIFAIPFDEQLGGNFHYHMKTLHNENQKTYNMTVQPWGGSCAIPQFVDTYDVDDSRLEDTWIMGQQYDYKGNMLYCSVEASRKDDPLSFTNTATHIDLCKEDEGYRLGKYEIKMGALGSLSNDFPLFRYADIYLMKAECLLRTGKSGAGALVTEVRKRNFSSNPAKATVTDADLLKGSCYEYGEFHEGNFIEYQGGSDIQFGRLLDEYGWEFAGEAHRRMDLIRFGVYTTKKWFCKTRVGDDKRKYFPIYETILNDNPNLIQNKGY